MVAFGFAALGVITGCEPAPPPPAAAPTTPANLVSRAQFDVIVNGMSLADVEWALGKRLTLIYESSDVLPNSVTLVLQAYVYESEVGDCRQRLTFRFENVDDNINSVPLHVYDKSKQEVSCGGVVK